jgi:hypothetical protein
VKGLAIEIERMADLSRLGPRAERLGLVPPTPDVVSLLPVSTVVASSGARPLHGADALGRLLRHAAWFAPPATADMGGGTDHAHSGADQPTVAAAYVLHSEQCKYCRAAAACDRQTMP